MEKKLRALTWYTCREYDDGNAEITRSTLDQLSRRVVPVHLCTYDQTGPEPYTADEMIMIWAMERVGAQLSEQYGLF